MSTPLPATVPELRHARISLDALEVRDGEQTGDGSLTLTGHAAVFEQETELFDMGWLRLREKIAPGAFSDVLGRQPDVHLTIGHDFDKAMARTGVDGVGGLELSEDDTGLRVFARLDPAISFVRDLALQMRQGIVDQMSFMFTVAKDKREVETDEEGNEDELRTIMEVRDLFDVTVVAQGAYPQTDASLRAAIQAMSNRGRRDIWVPGATEDVAPLVGVESVEPETAGADERKRRARLKAEVALTLGGKR